MEIICENDLLNVPLKVHIIRPCFAFALSLTTSLEPSTVTQSSGPHDRGGTSCMNFMISGLEIFN